MNKFFSITCVCAFCFSPHVQSQNTQVQMQTLVQKADSLEHELSYLKLSYELSTLKSDITILKNEVGITSASLKVDIYNRNFSSKLSDSNQQYYEACLEQKDSFSKLIEAKKTFFAFNIITHPYSDSELDVLITNYNVITKAFDALEKSIELLKITIDIYTEHCNRQK